MHMIYRWSILRPEKTIHSHWFVSSWNHTKKYSKYIVELSIKPNQFNCTKNCNYFPSWEQWNKEKRERARTHTQQMLCNYNLKQLVQRVSGELKILVIRNQKHVKFRNHVSKVTFFQININSFKWSQRNNETKILLLWWFIRWDFFFTLKMKKTSKRNEKKITMLFLLFIMFTSAIAYRIWNDYAEQTSADHFEQLQIKCTAVVWMSLCETILTT